MPTGRTMSHRGTLAPRLRRLAKTNVRYLNTKSSERLHTAATATAGTVDFFFRRSHAAHRPKL